MDARQKLSAGRLMACSRWPYFRAALMALVPREVPRGSLRTFGVTERGVLMWDAEAAERWTVEQVAAVLAHEVGHVLRHHAARCKALGAEHFAWNCAGDAEINDDLVAAGLKLPDGCILPKDFELPDGRLAEEYYHAKRQKGRGGDAKRQGKKGKKGQESEQAANGGGDDEDGESPGKGGGKEGEKGGVSGGTPKGNVGAGQCGGAAGNPNPGEEEYDPDGRTEGEIHSIRRQVAEAVKEYAEKARGTVPGGWARWADEVIKPPKIRWQDKLARVARGSVAYRRGSLDYHYGRPSRRQAGVGYGPGHPILPAMRTPIPRVAVIVDTSGSMGTSELMRAASETKGILLAAGADLELCACDAAVHELRAVRRWQEIPGLLKGGGGTDMRPAFEALGRRARPPDLTVVLTDGQIGNGYPVEPPAYKVCWVLVGKCRARPSCPWGEFVEVEEEDDEVRTEA